MASKGSKLREALDRAKRLELELLHTCEGEQKSHVLAAWKETIGEEVLDLLRSTNDPDVIGLLDINVAIAVAHCQSKSK